MGNRQTTQSDELNREILKPASRRPHSRWLLSFVLHVITWGYLLFLLAAWYLIHAQGERWWLATLVLFGPRWLFGLPLALLVPLVGLLRRRLLWGVTISALIFAFAICQLAIPWRTVLLPSSSTVHLRVMTCNTHRAWLNVPALQQVIKDANPDVVVLQEWTSDQAPVLFPASDWHFRIAVDMLVASKYPIHYLRNVLPPHSGLEGAAYSCELSAPSGMIDLINLHLASPHLVFAAAVHRKPDAPDEIADNCLERRIESELISHAAANCTLVAGDFNTPIDSEIFRNAWTNFHDAFAFAGWGTGVTYRIKGTRTRIDHILYNKNWQCRHCWLGPDVGSPHLPVIADLEMRR